MTRDQIRARFDDGVATGATHMIIARDDFDGDCYPVYVMPGENARERESKINAESMQRVVEVYNLGMDRDAQLAERRAFNY